MLTLYGNLESGNVYKVRLILAATGVAHRRVEVNQVQGDPKTPAFRAINPIGKVPAVQFDDGRYLAESGALLYWFARNSRYFPDDGWAQAQILQWMFFEQYSHEPYIAVNRYLMHYAPPGDPRLAQLAPNAQKGAFALSVMEQHLTGHDWFALTGYSIADMALYAYTHVADEGGFDLAPYPQIRAWLDRVTQQPGYVPMMRETSAEPVRRLAR
ncbi:MAG: glutathione S-transferase [Rhodospirillaceae bacterium]|jgi:glutathione S-transferase|nr:glutathione S-transferase [Rhodospirillaceae bacterium]